MSIKAGSTGQLLTFSVCSGCFSLKANETARTSSKPQAWALMSQCLQLEIYPCDWAMEEAVAFQSGFWRAVTCILWAVDSYLRAWWDGTPAGSWQRSRAENGLSCGQIGAGWLKAFVKRTWVVIWGKVELRHLRRDAWLWSEGRAAQVARAYRAPSPKFGYVGELQGQ